MNYAHAEVVRNIKIAICVWRKQKTAVKRQQMVRENGRLNHLPRKNDVVDDSVLKFNICAKIHSPCIEV